MAFWSLNHRSSAAPAATVDAVTYKAELEHAYDRGRLEARPRRRSFGLGAVLAFVTLVLAVLAVTYIVLAVQEGSFQAGGALIDQALSQISGGRIAAQPVAAAPPVAANAPAGSTAALAGSTVALPPGPAKPASDKTGGTSD